MVAQTASTVCSNTPTADPTETLELDTTVDPKNPLLNALVKLLAAGISDIPTLCQELDTTPAKIETLLLNPDLHEYLDTQTRLAQMSFRLQVLQLLPLAVKTFKAALTCDKPEVARRASVAICHLNHLPTSSPKEHPYHKPNYHYDTYTGKASYSF